MMEKTDHDILIRVETKVEGLTDEVRQMREGTKEDISKLYLLKLDKGTFEEHIKHDKEMLETIEKHGAKLELHDKLIYVGMGILLTLQFVIILLKK